MAMFDPSKKKTDASQAIHSLLGKGTLWKGEVHCGQHSLRIEGTVEGTIHSEGEITIAPSGLVTGTVHAKHLVVTGKAEGVFKIAECLEIHGTGSVEGDVEVGSLVVDEGGTLQGTCTRRGFKGHKEVLHGDKAGPKPERAESAKPERTESGKAEKPGTEAPAAETAPTPGKPEGRPGRN